MSNLEAFLVKWDFIKKKAHNNESAGLKNSQIYKRNKREIGRTQFLSSQ